MDGSTVSLGGSQVGRRRQQGVRVAILGAPCRGTHGRSERGQNGAGAGGVQQFGAHAGLGFPLGLLLELLHLIISFGDGEPAGAHELDVRVDLVRHMAPQIARRSLQRQEPARVERNLLVGASGMYRLDM